MSYLSRSAARREQRRRLLQAFGVETDQILPSRVSIADLISHRLRAPVVPRDPLDERGYFVPLRTRLQPCYRCGALVTVVAGESTGLHLVEPSPRTAEHGLGGPLVTRIVNRRRYGQTVSETQTGQMMKRHRCPAWETWT